MSGDRELSDFEKQLRNEMIKEMINGSKTLNSLVKLFILVWLNSWSHFLGDAFLKSSVFSNQNQIYQMMTEHDLGGKIKINKDDASDLLIRFC